MKWISSGSSYSTSNKPHQLLQSIEHFSIFCRKDNMQVGHPTETAESVMAHIIHHLPHALHRFLPLVTMYIAVALPILILPRCSAAIRQQQQQKRFKEINYLNKKHFCLQLIPHREKKVFGGPHCQCAESHSLCFSNCRHGHCHAIPSNSQECQQYPRTIA